MTVDRPRIFHVRQRYERRRPEMQFLLTTMIAAILYANGETAHRFAEFLF
jgi:hypothetical protein